MRKFTVLLLALLMLVPVMLGCSDGADKTEEAQTDQADTGGLLIVADGASDYVICRSKGADGSVKDAAYDIKVAIKEKCGVSLDIMDENEIDTQKAIYVGDVPPKTVTSFTEGLEYFDYVIGASNGDVIICGGSNEKTVEAAQRFITEFVSEPTDTLRVAKDLLIEQKGISRKTVKIASESLDEYSVIVRENELDGIKNEVQRICDHCLNNYAFKLNVAAPSVTESEKEIVIGTETGRKMSSALKAELAACSENQGLVWFEGAKVWLVGNSDAAVREAVMVFREEYLEKAKESDGVLSISTDKKISEFDSREYTVMTFNILCGDRSDGTTPQDRKNAVLTQIKQTSPDILGVQECTEWWYDILCEALGEEYGVVGELNNPSGQRWRNAIFYRKDRFDLIETKTQWLSKTPDVMSKVSQATQYRILTYAVLKDKINGKTFAHCNTHMGFNTGEQPAQWDALISLLEKIEYPIVLTGDFNTRRGTDVYKTLQNAGYYDAWNLTSKRHSGSPLDFCFLSVDDAHAKSHDILTELVDGIDPSDHNAVVAKVWLR